MAKVNIRGIGKISLSRDAAKEILAFKNDPQFNASDKFTGHGMDFEKRDIGGIVLDDFEEDDRSASDSRKSENEEWYREENKNYEDRITARCKKHWTQKATEFVQYETIYKLFGTPTDSFRNEVVKRQTAYFQKYPSHPFAIIEIKDLLPKQAQGHDMHLSGTLPSRIISHVYEAMYTGLQTAKKLHHA